MSIEKFLDDYAKQLAQLNADKLASFFTTPNLTILDQEISSWKNGEELTQTLLESLFNWYRSQGFAILSHRIVNITHLSDNIATVVVGWKLQREDQETWVYQNAYHLKRDKDIKEWKIYGIVQHLE
ncbi:hypothetical protein HZU77_008220 [Neisseriaceae bacterium TC5R-5]|nr:hypothetical protein [Neisseriaceae bacterium TC5R-5]